jgi:hypothetical protein
MDYYKGVDLCMNLDAYIEALQALVTAHPSDLGDENSVLSLLYEVLGLTRWTTAFFDLLFSGLCAVAAFLFMVVFLDGNVRIYPWAGMLLGGLPVVHLTGTLRQKIQRRLRLRRRLRQSGRALDGVQQLWIKKRKNRKKEQKNL